MAKKLTYVTFVLDETGSMDSIRDDTIGGFNAYLRQLQKDVPKARFTLLKFDSNRVEKVCVDKQILGVPPLTRDTYRPGAFTPLIDAACKAIIATAEKVAEKKANVAITIQTDGHENASREYKLEDLVDLIKEKTAAGWLFTFLGAGIDAFDTARSFGIAVNQTMNYDRDRSDAAMKGAAASTARYAASGLAASGSFSAQERAATGGHMPRGTGPGTGTMVPPPAKAAKRVGRDKSRPKRKAIVDDFVL